MVTFISQCTVKKNRTTFVMAHLEMYLSLMLKVSRHFFYVRLFREGKLLIYCQLRCGAGCVFVSCCNEASDFLRIFLYRTLSSLGLWIWTVVMCLENYFEICLPPVWQVQFTKLIIFYHHSHAIQSSNTYSNNNTYSMLLFTSRQNIISRDFTQITCNSRKEMWQTISPVVMCYEINGIVAPVSLQW